MNFVSTAFPVIDLQLPKLYLIIQQRTHLPWVLQLLIWSPAELHCLHPCQKAVVFSFPWPSILRRSVWTNAETRKSVGFPLQQMLKKGLDNSARWCVGKSWVLTIEQWLIGKTESVSTTHQQIQVEMSAPGMILHEWWHTSWSRAVFLKLLLLQQMPTATQMEMSALCYPRQLVICPMLS